MNTATDIRWTTADLKLFPDDGNRYEIIDGELLVTKAPHWKHQNVADNYLYRIKALVKANWFRRCSYNSWNNFY